MTNLPEPDDGLVRRLRAIGQIPVDPATQSRHLTAMAEVAAAPTPLGSARRKATVAAAAVAGFLAGTTGLASAGALGPLQPIAARAIEATTPFTVTDPDDAGTARFREGCDTTVTFENRGSYLRGIREKYGEDSQELADAKASDCGMPLTSVQPTAGERGGTGGAPDRRGKSHQRGEPGGNDATTRSTAPRAGHDKGAAGTKDDGSGHEGDRHHPAGEHDGAPGAGAGHRPAGAGRPAGVPAAGDPSPVDGS